MQLSTFFAGARLSLVALHLFIGALQVALFFPWMRHEQRSRRKQKWSRGLLRILRIRVEFAGDGPPPDMQEGLLVCNHVSFIDIFVINAVLPAGFVSKDEVARWPLIGWLSRHNDTVFLARGSRRAAHQTQQLMVDALTAGRRLAVFPEGTTTAGDQVLPFHGALLQSAIDATVPLHALALSYHGADGEPSTAPAYIDDVELMQCLLATLRAGGITARLTLAATYPPPHPDRRHLGHHAHHAIANAVQRQRKLSVMQQQ